MPKELTHCLFVDRAVEALSKRSQFMGDFAGALKRDRVAMHMGAVMVDTFFYALHVPVIERKFPGFGEIVHGAGGENTARLPLALLEAARATEDPAIKNERVAFAAGFLTHAALDSVLHPFVYNVTGNYYATDARARRGATARHRLLESWLDLHMLKQAGLDRWTNGLMAAITASPSAPRLRNFYAAAADLTFALPESAGPAIARGWRLQSFANRLFANAAFARGLAWVNRKIGRALDPYLALCYDWRGGQVPREIVEFESFRHPVSGEPVNGDLSRLMADAEARAVAYLEAVARFVSGGTVETFRQAVVGLSLDFGTKGARTADARHFDLIPDARLWPGGEAAD